MSHVFMSRPVSSSVLKWHECVNVTRVYHACHVLCKVSRLFVYARVMFCTKCYTGLCHCPFHVRCEMSREFMPVSCSVQNVTRVYAVVMFCAKRHPCLCTCHVLWEMPHMFMPLAVSCYVQNATSDYAVGRVMFCTKCHTWLYHWPCHVMCKMPHVIMPLAVSCYVQNTTRDYAIGRVTFCAKCHECLCHWPCHVMCKISRVVMPVSCSRRNVTRIYPRKYILRKISHLFMPLPASRSVQKVIGVYFMHGSCSLKMPQVFI